jgi:glycosyltransferase involved in cell wall biosynthesis
MDICIESPILNHHRRSGLMTYAEGLVNGLFENDTVNDYTLLFYSLRHGSKDMPGPSGRNFKKEVLKVPDQEFWQRQFLLDQILLPGYLKSKKMKVFHRPSGYTMPSLKDIFRVLTVHDLRTLTIGDEFCRQKISGYEQTLGQLDMCVVVSECTKQDILKHFDIDEKKIRVIYLGADKRFKPAPAADIEAVKRKYKINGPFLLSIGSVPRKNIDGIIRGFALSKAHKDFILVLSCNMEVEKYRQMAAELGVGGRMMILSQLTDQEVVALYSSCHAFVFPSLYEGFGLPILEAMQCGAPVITSDMSSCPEVAGDAAILIDPRNAQELSAAIDSMCTDNALRNGLIHKGFERTKRFSWDSFATEMRKVYALAK